MGVTDGTFFRKVSSVGLSTISFFLFEKKEKRMPLQSLTRPPIKKIKIENNEKHHHHRQQQRIWSESFNRYCRQRLFCF